MTQEAPQCGFSLDEVALCDDVDCSRVFPAVQKSCPICGSSTWTLLSVFLGDRAKRYRAPARRRPIHLVVPVRWGSRLVAAQSTLPAGRSAQGVLGAHSDAAPCR